MEKLLRQLQEQTRIERTGTFGNKFSYSGIKQRERPTVDNEDQENNLMEFDDIESEEEHDNVPELIPREENEHRHESNIVSNQQILSRETRTEVRRKTARASEIFTLENKNGEKTEYLGLLDTGSTGGLITKDLVEIYGFETQDNDSTWDTNAGFFKTGNTTFAKKLRFPQFTNKRVINNAKMYINPNHNQKYKMIFGLDFLIANKFDFLLSNETVRWQGVEIDIYNNDFPEERK